MNEAPISVDKLIEDMGGATKAAAALGISNPSVILNWRKRKQVPADRVLKVEEVSGVSRHQLRPDIFGGA
jgi:DNA-binding transcriptional regulator YdaS (Cro superfamily)